MKRIVSSISCIVTDDGDLYLDPTSEELAKCRSSHLFVFDNNDCLVACDSLGDFTDEEVFSL